MTRSLNGFIIEELGYVPERGESLEMQGVRIDVVDASEDTVAVIADGGEYGTGETDYEVPLRDYGFELRYRRQISREWLFVELLTYVNWPRDFLTEQRERNVGVGIEFEMQFGDWPGRPPQP